MNYKLLVSRGGISLLAVGDTFTLTNAVPSPDLFDAELIDVLPVQSDQKFVAVVAEPIYNMLIESQQILSA